MDVVWGMKNLEFQMLNIGEGFDDKKRTEISSKIFDALNKIDFDGLINDNADPEIKDTSASITMSNILASEAMYYTLKAIEISKKRNLKKVGSAAIIIAAHKDWQDKETGKVE